MKKNNGYIGYAAENDCRAISKDGLLWNALNDENGELKPLVDLVNKKEDLEMCFRGNSSTESITVYYNNNQFLRIFESKGKIKYEYNKNHARYYESYDEIKKINGDMTDAIKNHEFELFYKYRQIVMDSYFNPDKKTDFLKDDHSGIQLEKKDCKYEKQEQQRLMSANTNRKNGYYIYDMEYAQAFYSDDKKNEYMREVEKLMKSGSKCYNKPDSLAIRYEGGEPKALVFVELKTTRSAMSSGSSSAVKHIEGMRNFVEMDKKINGGLFLKNRKIEAQKIMDEYGQLGLHKLTEGDHIEDFSNLPIEYLLVITGNEYKNLKYNDTAKAYYDNDKVKQRINSKASECQCGIIVLEPKDFELNYDKVMYFTH